MLMAVFVLTVLGLAPFCIFSVYAENEVPSVQWQQTYRNGDGCSVLQTTDGGYVLSANDSANTYLIKTDPQGEQLWVRT
jgi:hypothetical protein